MMTIVAAQPPAYPPKVTERSTGSCAGSPFHHASESAPSAERLLETVRGHVQVDSIEGVFLPYPFTDALRLKDAVDFTLYIRQI